MVASNITLTESLRNKILGAVRAGAYPHVAAEAFGVPKRTFEDWLARGDREGSEEAYTQFARDTREASSVARLLVEAELYKNDPKTWLVHGPGRETSERPGWSVSVKAAEFAKSVVNVLCIPEVMDVFNQLSELFEPESEAGQRMRKFLTQTGISQPREIHHGAPSVQVDVRSCERQQNQAEQKGHPEHQAGNGRGGDRSLSDLPINADRPHGPPWSGVLLPLPRAQEGGVSATQMNRVTENGEPRNLGPPSPGT
jgi:hypothetical protein